MSNAQNNSLTFKRVKEHDFGTGYTTYYVCGNWKIVNIDSAWMVLYKESQMAFVNTYKNAKQYANENNK